MKTPLLTVVAVLLAAAPLAAQPEALSLSAAEHFAAAVVAAPAFRFVAASPAALALKAAGVQAQSVTVLDIEKLYDAGAKVSASDVTGWFSGRRYGAQGASAQLLVGTAVLKSPEDGSLGGSDLKLASFGGNQPGVVPADLFDIMGSETANNILARIYEDGAQWKTASFTDTGVRGQDSWSAFEVRKSGDLLVAKYADGSFAYFFKKVR